MNSKQKKKNISCPECDNALDLSANIAIGKIIECPACAIECEIVAISPIILAPLEEEK